MPEQQQNITNIPSSRVDFIDPRTGMISREWYRFFLNLFNLAGGGGNQTSLDDLQLGPPPQPTTTSGSSGSGTVTSVDVSGGATGISTSGGPITSSGTITLGLTGQLQTPTAIQMGNGSATTLAAGRMWYDQTTGSWNLGMGNGNITQQVGEELFIYGKASAAITDSPLQIVYHTGTVGASGVITFAPTVAGITDVNAIIGIATENLALNGFGRITTFGVVHGITTNGAAYGETWADDDPIWYNPVTGNPTKVKPSAPNIKVQVGLVIKAGPGGSGSFQVLVSPGSVLGGTDSNVQFGTLANNDLIAYDSGLGYWKNIPGTSYGTGSVTSVGLALPSIMSVSGSPVTTSGTLTGTLTTQAINTLFAGPSSGAAAAPTFRALTTADIPALSYVTSVAATVPAFLSVSGSPITSSGTLAISYSGTALPIANGGTGQTTASAAFNALSPVTSTGDLILGNGVNSATRLPIGLNNYVLTSNGTTAAWAAASGSGATISNDTATATNLYPLFANATSGAVSTIYTGDAKYLYKPSTGELTATAHVSSNGIQINANTVATSYTIATGNNGLSAGPVSVSTGVTVTVSTGSTWVVV